MSYDYGVQRKLRLADVMSEMEIIGCLLYDHERYMKVPGNVREWMFYEPLHGAIFQEAIRRLVRGELFEPISLAESLTENPHFQLLGGIRYLADLVDRARGGDAFGLALHMVESCALYRTEGTRYIAQAMRDAGDGPEGVDA